MSKVAVQKQNNQRAYDALLFVLLIVFIAIKFNDLFLPYFWDELGVYAQAAVYQYKYGLSLLPASLPPDLSRGHPLLFFFLNGVALKFFGNSVVVAHSINLFVAVVLLVAIYAFTVKYYNRLTAFVSTVLLATQPVFLAQSALVLPEIMLSLFAFLALVFYFEKKYLAFAFFASLAILTKESAVILPCVVFAYSVFRRIIFKENNNAFRPFNLLLTVFPYLVFGGFLLLQKAQNGWYFFPYHINHVSLDVENAFTQFSDFFDAVFWQQGRYWWKNCMLLALPFAFVTNKFSRENARKSILVLFGIFILAFLAFSSLSFYMDRYVTALIIPASILTGVSVVAIFRNKILVLPVTLLLGFVAFQHFETNTFSYDFDMGYRRQINVLRQAIDYCYEISGTRRPVDGNFPAYFAVNFNEGGYLKNGDKGKFRRGTPEEPGYYILCNPGDLSNYNHNLYEGKLLKICKDGFAEAVVYELKPRDQ